MQISLLLMEEIAKLFAIMLMGYAVVKAGLMKSSESKSISVVMVYLVIPCVIIDAFQVDYTADVKKGLLLACVAAVLVHVLFLILTTILKQALQLDTIERATVIYSNAGILVIPLVQDLLGQEYVIYSSAYIAVQLILIWTHCKNMLCEEDRLEWKKVFLNVNIISIIVGVILFVCKIQLPSGMQDVLDMMNNMIGPIGMLLAGMVIADVPLKTVFTKKRNYVSTVLRLVIYPIFILILMKMINTFAGVNDSKQILLTVYIASITPACATVTSMAQLYDKDAAYASSLYVLTTLLSNTQRPANPHLIFCKENGYGFAGLYVLLLVGRFCSLGIVMYKFHILCCNIQVLTHFFNSRTWVTHFEAQENTFMRFYRIFVDHFIGKRVTTVNSKTLQ